MSEQFETVDTPKFPKEWITTSEAAELSGYRQSSIRRSLIAGTIPGEKHGRDWFIKRSDILEYVRRMRELGKKKHTPKVYLQSEE